MPIPSVLPNSTLPEGTEQPFSVSLGHVCQLRLPVCIHNDGLPAVRMRCTRSCLSVGEGNSRFPYQV